MSSISDLYIKNRDSCNYLTHKIHMLAFEWRLYNIPNEIETAAFVYDGCDEP